MDHLTTPWRYAYVTTADKAVRPGVPARLAAWQGDTGCVFCNLIASADYAVAQGMRAEEAEEAAGVIWRGQECFVCLNAYPYSSGHVMVMPYAHVDRLGKLTESAAHELMDLARRVERALEEIYHPDGLNFGFNLGKAAGAGVAAHLHLHGLPRWVGDTNFMTAVGETRIIPESLDVTWRRVREAMQKEA